MCDRAITLPVIRLDREHIDLAHQRTDGPGIEFNNVVQLWQERINRAWLRLVEEQHES